MPRTGVAHNAVGRRCTDLDAEFADGRFSFFVAFLALVSGNVVPMTCCGQQQRCTAWFCIVVIRELLWRSNATIAR
jgi:hypothetical protein